MLAETTLADERHCQKEAERSAMSGETVLAVEQRCSLLAAQAAEMELATARVAVLADSLLPKPALAKDKWRQEETAKKQRRSDDELVMVRVLPPNSVNTAIWRIWVECALLAAPLDAILAKSECDDITHEARAPPTTTLPHPAAMLSTPPRPMTYVGVVLSMMGGSTRATSLALALLAIPSPIVDDQLRMVRQCAQPCRCTGSCRRPCTPNPPDEVLPSHPHPTVEGLSTPSNPPNLLARAPIRSGTPSLAPPSMASSTPSLLPFTFGSEVCLSLEEVVAYPFCAGGLTPPPWKRKQCKHQPLCICLCHGPRAPNPQEHLLCGWGHRPRAPNQSTLNG